MPSNACRCCGYPSSEIPASKCGARGSSTLIAGLTATRSVSIRFASRNMRKVRGPPSMKSRRIPRFSSSVTIRAAVSSGQRISVAEASSGVGASLVVKIRRLPRPVVKNFAQGSSRSDRLNVTFIGSAPRPSASRRRCSVSSWSVSDGSSRRIVSAPTKMASASARSRSTSRQSAGVESISRRDEQSSMQPSPDRATEAKVFIVAVR